MIDPASEWRETLKSVVNVWQCDQMGHMNTRHIEGLFDDASAYLIDALCGGLRTLTESGVGWADRRHVFEFKREILAGDAIDVRSRVSKVGRTSLTIVHEMYRAGDCTVLAEAEVVCVCFDLTERRARPVPDVVRERLGAGERPPSYVHEEG